MRKEVIGSNMCFKRLRGSNDFGGACKVKIFFCVANRSGNLTFFACVCSGERGVRSGFNCDPIVHLVR